MRPLSLLCLLLAFSACSHQKKEGPPYSPVVSFQEDQKTFTANVNLPRGVKKPVPLVVIVHEWWGRTPYIESKAQELVKSGHATLAVDLFGNGETSDNPKGAGALATPFYQNPALGIGRLRKYLSLAKLDPHVDPSRVYVIGYCFGGTQALNLARSGEDLKGVVAFHAGLTTTYSSEAPVKARILALNGATDPMVPPRDVKAFEKEMTEEKANFRIVNYPGATHAFTNPGATAIGRKYKIPVAYDKAADMASWKELTEFLRH